MIKQIASVAFSAAKFVVRCATKDIPTLVCAVAITDAIAYRCLNKGMVASLQSAQSSEVLPETKSFWDRLFTSGGGEK
ncbi:hypothetical protein COB21_01980 [Candidatus Aerophobetes bacterium]|uniref:Uncharacterized protein n=1 Tax=Aerophobetes bacterium TaxID=2030807 RepID=A0A2A4X6M8_UNCAE|nr:MAG: hypothetical protein COB21_01980 [Candidatus Aerophobetes bacterium]